MAPASDVTRVLKAGSRAGNPYNPAMSDVTRVLKDIEAGEPKAADQLLPLVYEELRKLAVVRMANEKPGQTLQPTALVHEAWLKIAGDGKEHFANHRHFFKAAATADPYRAISSNCRAFECSSSASMAIRVIRISPTIASRTPLPIRGRTTITPLGAGSSLCQRMFARPSRLMQAKPDALLAKLPGISSDRYGHQSPPSPSHRSKTC